MSRIVIDIPDKHIHKSSVTVRITDINYGGHTGNDTILKYMHEARMNFLSSLGIKDEVRIIENIGWIVSDAAVVYKAETFYGDSIKILIGVDGYHKIGFDMFYLLLDSESGKEIARGKTGLIFFDYEKRKVAPAPQSVLQKINMLPAINKDGNYS